MLTYLEGRIRTDGPDAELYTAMLDYPLREAKGLRPALCIALCRALGGRLEEAIPSAATIELYHNAFLIHDDVEDGSEARRDGPTLHHTVGEAFAINVGDAMLAHSLEPLLENMKILDVGRALEVLELVAEMSRISAEGQAMELGWIRDRVWDVTEDDYVRMVTKKTAWYTFVAPLEIGAIVAERRDLRAVVREFALHLGIAFQIQDDILNLEGDAAIGKESCGDLWEGKRTLMLSHFLGTASADRAERARRILAKRRPTARDRRVIAILSALRRDGALTRAGEEALYDELLRDGMKDEDDVRSLHRWLVEQGSIDAAKVVARRHADEAARAWTKLRPALDACEHTAFLDVIAEYVIERGW